METKEKALLQGRFIELYHLRNSYWKQPMSYWEPLFSQDWRYGRKDGSYIRLLHTLDVFPCEERAAFQVEVGVGDNIYWRSIPRPCYEILDDIIKGARYFYHLEEVSQLV